MLRWPCCARADTARLRFPATPNSTASRIGEWRLRWEQHTEFTTYTWSTYKDADEPFTHPDPLGDGEIAFRAPGRLIVATHLCAIEGGAPSHEPSSALFNSQSLCVIRAAKGAAHVMTDFAPDAHGFTRLLVKTERHRWRSRSGRLVQRILEIETYRTMALLGLPEARRASPELGAMEQRNRRRHPCAQPNAGHAHQPDLLKRLSDLAGAERGAVDAHRFPLRREPRLSRHRQKSA